MMWRKLLLLLLPALPPLAATLLAGPDLLLLLLLLLMLLLILGLRLGGWAGGKVVGLAFDGSEGARVHIDNIDTVVRNTWFWT